MSVSVRDPRDGHSASAPQGTGDGGAIMLLPIDHRPCTCMARPLKLPWIQAFMSNGKMKKNRLFSRSLRTGKRIGFKFENVNKYWTEFFYVNERKARGGSKTRWIGWGMLWKKRWRIQETRQSQGNWDENGKENTRTMGIHESRT